MITAQEAREKSLYILQAKKDCALKWVQKELPDIEKKILSEAQKGKYDTDYQWNKNLLTEAGTTQKEAATALTVILSDLGYQTAYTFNFGLDHDVFKVYINWAEDEKNE